MAISNIPLIASGILYINTDTNETYSAIKASSTVLYEIEIDNTANAASTFVKLYNNAAPTVGTTAPDMIILVPASVSRTLVIPSGITFATALSIAALTAGGTAGSTGPTSDVTTRVVYV